MNLKPKHIFLVLCTAFLIYSGTIYLRPCFISAPKNFNTEKAARGRLVWQNYNCQACHQFYGLGGYLGPDLTNIYSQKGKGELVVRAMIKSGTKQMPAYHLSENEISELLEFLKSTDESGVASPKAFETNSFLMIEQKPRP